MKCLYCKVLIHKKEYLCINNRFFCAIPCATKFSLHKIRLNDLKALRKDKRKYREEDTAHQTKLTQTVFNRMRKLQELAYFKSIGEEPTCISCAKPLGKDVWCTGHYKDAGNTSRLRFSELNTYLQHNVRCNDKLGGDPTGDLSKGRRGFTQGILDRHGDKGEEVLRELNSKQEFIKLTAKQLRDLRASLRLSVRELELSLHND